MQGRLSAGSCCVCLGVCIGMQTSVCLCIGMQASGGCLLSALEGGVWTDRGQAAEDTPCRLLTLHNHTDTQTHTRTVSWGSGQRSGGMQPLHPCGFLLSHTAATKWAWHHIQWTLSALSTTCWWRLQWSQMWGEDREWGDTLHVIRLFYAWAITSSKKVAWALLDMELIL